MSGENMSYHHYNHCDRAATAKADHSKAACHQANNPGKGSQVCRKQASAVYRSSMKSCLGGGSHQFDKEPKPKHRYGD